MIWTIVVAVMAGYIMARTTVKLIRLDARKWREQVNGPEPDLSLLEHDPLLEEFHRAGLFTEEELALVQKGTPGMAYLVTHDSAMQQRVLMSQQQGSFADQMFNPQRDLSQQFGPRGLSGLFGALGAGAGGLGSGAFRGLLGPSQLGKKNPFDNN